jgi:hypothetical protein
MAESSQQKGNRLEGAVAAIEEIILRDSPGYSKDRFRIFTKRTVVADGVRHEIDIYVEIDHGKGYDTVFIFECKNWEEAVDKNEIIVFGEKIRATNAQRGFFVARSYSRYATAQAARDPRIVLLYASDTPPELTPVPFSFHWVNIELLEFPELNVIARKETVPPGSSPRLDIDPETVQLVIKGAPVALSAYLRAWGYDAAQQQVNKVMTAEMAEGKYDYALKDTRSFQPGEVILNGYEISSMTLDVLYQVHLFQPAVSSHVEVDGRGRVVEMEPVRFFQRDLKAVFVGTEGGWLSAMRVESSEPSSPRPKESSDIPEDSSQREKGTN